MIVFAVSIATVGLFAALHASAYFQGEAKNHLPRFWAFYGTTLLAMAGVLLSRGKLEFLLAWEAMGLASAGLVAFESREKSVRKATWIYLLACHAGACALMLSAVLLDRFDAAFAAFLLAVIGFGLKIGFPPFHVWLPEAHPAAPAPASAVMSGAMIPLGFYGLLRFFPDYMPGAWVLIGLGAIASIGGILFALPQANLKKLLAFSSVENMGIVSLGIGLSFLASDQKNSPIVSLALTGALLHVLNHAFLKGGAFLCAGSVMRQTGTLDQDRLGGLLRRMPRTGTLFVLNALGLAGLPPLNGFLGELLIYLAAFEAVRCGSSSFMLAGFTVLVALSLSGGLALAAYVKAIGATFLGEPRSASAAAACETPRRMVLAIAGLFACSLLMIPVSGWIASRRLGAAAANFIWTAVAIGLLVVVMTLALVLFRRFVCPRGKVRQSCPTWDCGYDDPTARMAYTGTAITQPIVDFCSPILRSRRHLIAFRGPPAKPTDAAIATETDDFALEHFWRPLFRFVARLFQRIHLLQNGSLHLYILLVILAVLILLAAALLFS